MRSTPWRIYKRVEKAMPVDFITDPRHGNFYRMEPCGLHFIECIDFVLEVIQVNAEFTHTHAILIFSNVHAGRGFLKFRCPVD